MGEFNLGLTLLSDLIWVGLLTLWGGFWRCDQLLNADTEIGDATSSLSPPSLSPPYICAIIPARNEADVIATSLRSLLLQDYPGRFEVVLVDDQSTDGTADVARQTAASLGKADQLTVIQGEPLPTRWTGKLWAMEQGNRYTQTLSPRPDYILFTDADIEHDRANVKQLAAKAMQDDLDLVSLMVLLRCQSGWEKLLIPAFVFFFQKLYPFRWVNNPDRQTAAAAGGCLLIRRTALERIGGLQILRQALIDDCSLARAVKGEKAEVRSQESGVRSQESGVRSQESPTPSTLPTPHSPLPAPHSLLPTSFHPIWLGLTQTTRSLRPYDSLETIWNMVARSAYTQLHYSPVLLMGTLVGMTLVYLVAPIAAVGGLFTANWGLMLIGVAGWALMTLAYLPTVRWYGLSPVWAVSLPAIAVFYTLMTIDSALRHWRGKGGAWKGRTYA